MAIHDLPLPGVAARVPAPRLSALLAGLRAELCQAASSPRVTLAQALDLVQERAFGGVLLLLTLPCLLPVPPVLSMLMEGPLLLVSAQMILGRGQPWLPGRVRRLGLARPRAVAMIDAVLPRLHRVEALVRVRWTTLTTQSARRGLGVICFLSASLVGLPVPLIGWLPAFALALMALGLVGEDGVLVLAGVALGLAGIAAGALLLLGTIDMGDHLLRTLES
ncbi:exopolysaccharide biosynthesis protein [Zavarzinia sp. CC-PAN008]|uniref:exopolysaccharide biosynthesis protein n=1 Tax=Zavarzinia sp. CC-PAN008 TaxID=3243332 RepID=UPI003F74427D